MPVIDRGTACEIVSAGFIPISTVAGYQHHRGDQDAIRMSGISIARISDVICIRRSEKNRAAEVLAQLSAEASATSTRKTS